MDDFKQKFIRLLKRKDCFFSWEEDKFKDYIYLVEHANNDYFYNLADVILKLKGKVMVTSDVSAGRSLILLSSNWEDAYKKLLKI